VSQKQWKPFEDECDKCGAQAEVFTEAEKEGFAYDGDEARCPECGRKGGVSVDGPDEAWIVWNDEEAPNIQDKKPSPAEEPSASPKSCESASVGKVMTQSFEEWFNSDGVLGFSKTDFTKHVTRIAWLAAIAHSPEVVALRNNKAADESVADYLATQLEHWKTIAEERRKERDVFEVLGEELRSRNVAIAAELDIERANARLECERWNALELQFQNLLKENNDLKNQS
jgi:hypothetical protein